MSYDLSLVTRPGGSSFQMETTHIGGTMPVGGYTTTEFNITYNYSWFYHLLLDKEQGLRWLYGKTGAETIERLQSAIDALGSKVYKRHPDGFRTSGDIRSDFSEENYIMDYWAPTPGNAGAALEPLLEAAKLYPDGVWEGD